MLRVMKNYLLENKNGYYFDMMSFNDDDDDDGG